MVEKDWHELKEAFLLGVLFHDVGKIVQRAQEDPTRLTHQEWGYEWLLKHLPEQLKHRGLIAQIAKLHHAYSPKKTPFEKLENLSVFHETNKSNLTLLAYQSDNLSASERKPVSIEEQEYGAWQSDLALTSVFSKISLTHDKKKPKYNNCWRFLPGRVMSEIDMNYPVEDTKLDRNVYKQILTDFEYDLKLIGENLNINNALILYEKYCSYVPA
ncbi:MAG: HD domain-containing protein, partial [Calditrichaeota bacterium]